MSGSTAGKLTEVKKSGTPTAMTDEPMSNTIGDTYRIDDVLKRVWDRTVVPTFEDNAVAIVPADISLIDYLAGTVTFTASKTGPITLATGNYLPLATVAGANGYNLSISSDIIPSTCFTGSADPDQGYVTKTIGLKDVSGTIEKFYDVSQEFIALLQAGTEFVIEIRPGGGTLLYKGFFVLESDNLSGEVAALETESLSFQHVGAELGKNFTITNS